MTINTSLAPTGLRTDLDPQPLLDRASWRGAIGLTVLSLAGFGFLYALAGVGIGQALFSHPANGSLIERDGQVLGSALVAQPFVSERYFQSRPSAGGHDPRVLTGSNQARTNPEMRQRLNDTRTAIAQREGMYPSAIPDDLITQSGSGIDPHISPQGASVQIARIARMRGLDRRVVEGLVAQHTEGRQLGVLGQPRVHVLALNLALDALGTGATVLPQTPAPSRVP